MNKKPSKYSERAKKAAATRKLRYGDDVFKIIGTKGGNTPKKPHKKQK